jgi:hypothetical protein
MKHIIQFFGIALIAAGFFLFIGCGGGKKSTGAEAPRAPEGFSETSAAGVSFQWKLDGEEIEVILSAETEGWVAVGFNPSQMMQGANIIIGYVEDGQVKVRDDYGSWLTSHSPDETAGGAPHVTVLKGEEKKGRTTLRFTLPLDSGEDFEGSIRPGEDNTVILAHGNQDDFEGMHRGKDSITVRF